MKIAIPGIHGRMGRAITELALADKEITAIMGLERPGHDAAPLHAFCDNVKIHSQMSDLIGVDVMIDFTRPDYSLELATFAKEHDIPFVSGTTGFTEEAMAKLQAIAQFIPVFWASNMSIGVALVKQLVKQAAAQLPTSYDIEVQEMHHRHKVDAPSGTALTLGEAAAEGRGIDFQTNSVLSREGQTGERKEGSIGFATLRGGKVIGDHSVIFAGDHDVIELTHRSQSRSIYAEGALRAAAFLRGKRPGFYSMHDLLA